MRAKPSSTSKTYQSPGSIPTQIRGLEPRFTSHRPQKHMLEPTTQHQPTSSSSSDDWSLISGQATPERSQLIHPNHSVPTTPSKKQTFPQSVTPGNLTSPKMPATLRTPIKVLPLTPTRSRPSPINTAGTPTRGSGPIVQRSHHTPNSSTSSTSSSSSQDVNTPRTPSHRRSQFPRVINPSKFASAEDEFTIVLNEDEAIHWTKQTSDLRQPSPTRSNWIGENPSNTYSYPTSQQNPRPPMKMTPSRSNDQRLTAAARPDSRGIKQDQANKSWFSLSPRNGKSTGSRHAQLQEESVTMH